MPEASTSSGVKVAGYTEVRNGFCDKCHTQMDVVLDKYKCSTCGGNIGELIVAFNSLDVKTLEDNEYQKERITYCMRHKHDNIDKHLRSGGKLPLFKSKKGETDRLRELNLTEV